MKYFFCLLLCCTFFLSQAQDDPKQMPDFDELNLDQLDLSDLDLSNLDLNNIFGMLDSLPLELGKLGNLNQLFSENFGELSDNNELLNDLFQQGLKTFEQMDMTEMEGLMQNFMKDFEGFNLEGLKDFDGLNLDEMIDADEMEKIIDKHAKKRKI